MAWLNGVARRIRNASLNTNNLNPSRSIDFWIRVIDLGLIGVFLLGIIARLISPQAVFTTFFDSTAAAMLVSLAVRAVTNLNLRSKFKLRNRSSKGAVNSITSRDLIAMCERLLPEAHRESGIDHAYDMADRLLRDLPPVCERVIVLARIMMVVRISAGLWIGTLSESVKQFFTAE